MSATGTLFDSVLSDVSNANVKVADSYKVLLTTSAYTPARATHTKRSDVTNEITGTGYTAGGVAVVPTGALDTTAHTYTWTFPQVTWPSSTLTARVAVYYRSRGGASSADELIGAAVQSADVSTTSGTMTLPASTFVITGT